MATTAPTASTAASGGSHSLLNIGWNVDDWSLTIAVSFWVFVAAVAIVIVVLIVKWSQGGLSFKSFELDQAEIGVGSQKLKLKPNLTDRQVAYAIWVELSTRKIGLPIDFDHDVISEVYDSWYNYFSVTRELVKGVPVNKFKNDSTQQIIKLSISVLNDGIRPHLTRWQARFRYWYEKKLKAYENESGTDRVLDPQSIQKEFPEYDALTEDMKRVNENLIQYRRKMKELVLKD